MFFFCIFNRGIDFGELLSPENKAHHPNTTYDLIANIVHDGSPEAGKGTYRVCLLHKVQATIGSGAPLVVIVVIRINFSLASSKEILHWGECCAVVYFSCVDFLKGSGKWYELQDLQVVDILPQMITLSESYVQVT